MIDDYAKAMELVREMETNLGVAPVRKLCKDCLQRKCDIGSASQAQIGFLGEEQINARF